MRVFSLPFLHSLYELGPLLTRIGVGVVMALHGWTKLQSGSEGWLSGKMLAGLSVPAPEVMAWVVLIAELVGGILLVLGLITRISALAIAGVLVVALTQVKGFAFIADGQVWPGEIDWVLLFASLGLLFTGPGALAIDRLIGIERKR
jgi:putative oxidoreductase